MKYSNILFFLFFTVFVTGQSLQVAQDYLDRSDYRHAIPLYEKIIEATKQSHNIDLQVTAQNGLADCYLDLGATYKAMAILKQNIVLLNKSTTKNYLLAAKTHQLLAICYDKLFLLEDYLIETNTFYSYYKKAAPNKEIYKALYYAYLGRYYNMRFIIDKAFFYTSTALKIYHKHPDQKEVDPYIFYNAHLFTERNHEPNFAIKLQYVDSLRYFVNKRYPYDNLKKSRLLVSLAAPNIEVAANLYSNSGDYNLNIKCADRAISFYNKAIAMNDKLAGFYQPNAAFLNSLKGLMYFYKKDYKTALENYEIGIKRLTLSPYVFTNNNAVLFDLLKWKAWCLNDMYIQNNETKLLFEIEKTLLLEEKYWLQYSNDIIKNKQQFNSNVYVSSPFNDLAKNYYNLYLATSNEKYIALFYEYDQKSKHESLIGNSFDKNNKHYLETLFSEQQFIREKFDDLLLKTNQKILLLGLREDYKKKFEKSFKLYSNKQRKVFSLNKNRISSLRVLQDKLKNNEAILSYNLTGIQVHFPLFLLMISKSHLKLISLNSNLEIAEKQSKVIDFLNYLKKEDVSNYKRIAYDYYRLYFQPIESYLPQSVTQIKIMPNGSFSNFPFEMLLSAPAKSNDFSKLPYLLKKYQFSYGLSSSIANIVEKKVSKSSTFSVFSPNFSSKNLSELKESNSKSAELADLFDAHLLQGKDATKKAFSKHLENDKIVALLSHGSASDDEIESNKGIHFSDGFLSMNEVYNLKANCDFLLLGACESGVGYKSREGNINLARAFTAIGVKSMMLASWKIDEKSSSQIISSFLKYLNEGCTKSEALQKAKLEYLSTASPRMANPLYWAGLNITGNNETIRLQQKNYWWWGFGLIVVVGIGFLYLRYSKNKL